jgi:glycerol-3-phosphate acyltransferase PlsX
MALKLSIDVMGGDRTPDEAVIGACAFARENAGITVILVGREDNINSLLKREEEGVPSNIEIVHADEVVGMEESPVTAVKEKKDSSIAKAVNLVKEGKADAIISAGNTGVSVAQSTLGLRRIENIKRPGIINPFPSEKDIFYMIDAGANSETKAEFLFQHAVIGAVYCKYMLEKEHPRVALLNIGTEESKGNERVREAHRMINEIKNPFFEYKGFIEGTDLFTGEYDLVVSEGFVGNVVLKIAEGLSRSLMKVIKGEIASSLVRKAASSVLTGAFEEIKERFGYERYGGAMLLGVNGICTILHGASPRLAFINGLEATKKLCESEINEHITEYISLLKKDA